MIVIYHNWGLTHLKYQHHYYPIQFTKSFHIKYFTAWKHLEMKDTQQFIKSKLHILKMSNLNIGFSDTVGNKTGSNILERKKQKRKEKQF